MSMSSRCIACGAPMEAPRDHAMGDVRIHYCCSCALPDGSMRSYHDTLEATSAFIARTEGLSQESARYKASQWLARLPAWQYRRKQ